MILILDQGLPRGKGDRIVHRLVANHGSTGARPVGAKNPQCCDQGPCVSAIRACPEIELIGNRIDEKEDSVMIGEMPDTRRIVERLEKVERQNRRLKLTGVVALILASGILLMG
jgi:hypothetical protein